MVAIIIPLLMQCVEQITCVLFPDIPLISGATPVRYF
jgi:hypothetical protein